MDSSNQKIRHSADVNLTNAFIGCVINALITFPIHIFLLSIASSHHTLHGISYGIQITLVIIGGIPGCVIAIASVQRMNVTGDPIYSIIDDSGESSQPKSPENLIPAIAKALGGFVLFSIQHPVTCIKTLVGIILKLNLIYLLFFSGLIISGIMISEVIRLSLPILVIWAVIWVFFQLFLKLCKFLHHINTSSDWVTTDISSEKPIVQWMYSQMDIEHKAWLIDQKSTWTDLTPRQIQTKELLFILDYYWGVFRYWIRSTVSSTLPKIK
jgi:hypothetical protein